MLRMWTRGALCTLSCAPWPTVAPRTGSRLRCAASTGDNYVHLQSHAVRQDCSRVELWAWLNSCILAQGGEEAAALDEIPRVSDR